MGLFRRKKSKQEQQKERRESIVDRIDGFTLKWRPAFSADGCDKDVSEEAKCNLLKSRDYIFAMLYKDDGRVERYMDEIESKLDLLKNGWYNNSGGRDKVAEICSEVWRITCEWADI